MTTSSLAKQLKQLKERDQVATHIGDKLNASLLFDLKESGLVTLEKIRELAIDGYHNLTKILPQVANFQSLIFETKRIDRMKLQPKESLELSQKLKDLLVVLAANLLNINTLRVLEYLLRNYEIHKYEGEAIIIGFLAYHNTGPYTKLLQNLDLSSPTNKYHFLYENCRTGASVSILSLLHQTNLSTSFVTLYQTFLTRHFELLEGKDNSSSGSDITFALGFSSKQKDSYRSSPCLNFFAVFLSNLIQKGVSKASNLPFFRVSCLKFISFALKNQTLENINAALVLVSNLTESKLLKGQDLETVLEELQEKIENFKAKNDSQAASVVKLFAKLVIWTASIDASSWGKSGFEVVKKILPEAKKLGKSLLSVMLIWATWTLKTECFKKESELHSLIEWCFEHESMLQVDSKRRDVFSILLQNSPAKSSEGLLSLLVSCCGEELFSYLEQYVLYLETLSKKVAESQGSSSQEADEIIANYPDLDEKKTVLVKVLESNVLYKLIAVGSFSKMSVLSALRSGNRSIKVKALEILESDSTSASGNIQKELLEILEQEEDPNIVEKILGFGCFVSSSDENLEQVTSVLFKKFVQLKRKEIAAKIKTLALKTGNKLLQDLIAFFENLWSSKICLPSYSATATSSDGFGPLKTCLATIHSHTDLLTQGNFTAALLKHLQDHFQKLEELKAHGEILVYLKEQKITPFFNETHSADLLQVLEKQLTSGLALKNFSCMLEILLSYNSLYTLAAEASDSVEIKLQKLKQKDTEVYLETILSLLLDEESSSASGIHPSTFQIITELLPELETKKTKGAKFSNLLSIKNKFTLVLLKSLKNESFKNGHYLDLVRYLSHIFSADKKECFQTDFNRKIAKELIKNRVEWEGGVFTERWSDIRSFLLDSSQRAHSQQLLDQIFELCIVEKKFFELSAFLGILETVLGEGRNHLVKTESKDASETTNKSTSIREYLGKLLTQTLASDSSLNKISDALEATQLLGESEQKEADLAILNGYFTRVLQYSVKCQPSKKLKKLEQFMRKWRIYENIEGSVINELNQYTSFNSILVDLFSQNKKIQSFEEVKLTLEQTDHVFTNLDFSSSKTQISNFLSYLQSSETIPASNKSLSADNSEKLLRVSLRIVDFMVFLIDQVNSAKIRSVEIGLLSKCLQILNSINLVTPCLTTHAFTEKLKLNGDLILKMLPDWIGSSSAAAENTQEDVVSISSDEGGNIFGYLQSYCTLLVSTAPGQLPSLLNSLFAIFSEKVDKASIVEGQTSLSHIYVGVDKILRQILSIISKRLKAVGSKDGLIEIISKLALLWLQFRENHQINGLVRGLKRWYKKGKGKTPMESQEVWSACEDMRWMVKDVLKGDGESIALIINVLFVFYMNENRRRRDAQGSTDQKLHAHDEGSEVDEMEENHDASSSKKKLVDKAENQDEGYLDSPLEFQFFAHFLSKFLVTLDFVESDFVNKMSMVTKALISGLDILKGFIPFACQKSKKAYMCKVIRRLLSEDPLVSASTTITIDYKEVSLRSTRLCLFYHNFLNFFLKDSAVTQNITNAIIDSGDDFENSELIGDLEKLMNEGFKFDLEIEKIESSIVEKDTSKKLKIFGKLKAVCKANVDLISKFIPIEIYPLFLKKKLDVGDEESAKISKNSPKKPSSENLETDTMSRFTNAFIDRILDAKMSEKFKDYFSAAFQSFINYPPIIETTQGNLTPTQKFVQSFFTALGMVHKKLPTFTENLVSESYSKMLQIIQKQRNAVVKLGSLAALSNFSRNTNENFLEYLGNFVVLCQLGFYQIMQKCDLEKFQVLKDDYRVLFKDTGIEFHSILRKKLEKFDSKEAIHQSYANAKLPSVIIEIYFTLVANMDDIAEPYLLNILDSSLHLFTLHPEKCESQLDHLLDTVSKKISVINSIDKVGRLASFLKSKYLSVITLSKVNSLLEKIVSACKTQDISDTRDQVFKYTHNLLKLILNNQQDLSDQYDRERERAINILVTFSLKCSEKVFKTYFQKLLKSFKLVDDYGDANKESESDSQKSMEKKITFVKFVNSFVSKIGRFGVSYFGFLFDYYVGYLVHVHEVIEINAKNTSVGKKRSAQEANYKLTLKQVELHGLVMSSLELLFTNDKAGFIDSIKFEQLVKPLSSQISIHRICEEGGFVKYAENYIIPASSALFNLLEDEFMIKTLQYNILKIGTRHESTQVRIVAARLVMRVVDLLGQRYVAFLNDLVPFLSEMLDDEETEVSIISKNIVKNLQQHTTDDIMKIMQNTQMQYGLREYRIDFQT